jgi:hypothetical protein
MQRAERLSRSYGPLPPSQSSGGTAAELRARYAQIYAEVEEGAASLHEHGSFVQLWIIQITNVQLLGPELQVLEVDAERTMMRTAMQWGCALGACHGGLPWGPAQGASPRAHMVPGRLFQQDNKYWVAGWLFDDHDLLPPASYGGRTDGPYQANAELPARHILAIRDVDPAGVTSALFCSAETSIAEPHSAAAHFNRCDLCDAEGKLPCYEPAAFAAISGACNVYPNSAGYRVSPHGVAGSASS